MGSEVMRGLERVMRRDAPAVVHAHNWMSASFLPVKSRGSARLVATLHDYGLVCAKRSLMYRGALCSGPALAKCLRCAAGHYGTAKGMLIALGNRAMGAVERAAVDMYLPVSEAVAVGNHLHDHGTPYRVLPNFVPDDVAAGANPAHPSLAALPDVPYLLFVGALTQAKGVDVLLDAYGRLETAPPLVLVGTRWVDTPARLPANVTIIESVPHEAVMGAMRRSIALIVPSVFPDPCPTVVMEAMASGVPVIASRVGGIPDLVLDGETGMLVASGDAGALAGALRHVATTPAEAKRMGEAGLVAVSRFTSTTIIDRLEGIYQAVTTAPPTVRSAAGSPEASG